MQFLLKKQKYITAPILLTFILILLLAPLHLSFGSLSFEPTFALAKETQAIHNVDAPPNTINIGREGPPTCWAGVTSPLNVDGCVAWLVNIVLSGAGGITWVGGFVLDTAIYHSVVTMDNIANMKAVETAWRAVRDVGNIVIIFAFLIIGIATILRISSYGMKSLLARLLIVALLINFSLFFTKVVIDTGNLMSVVFYNQLTNNNQSACKRANSSDNCLSANIVSAVKLKTVFEVSNIQDAQISNEYKLDWKQMVFAGIMGVLLLLVAAFVFFAGGIMLIIRIVLLLFLLILSPLAFAAATLPGTQKYFRQWLDTLLRQVFFAPFYLLLLVISLAILSDETLQSLLNIADSNFGGALRGASQAGQIFLFFAIAMGLMVASLILAKQMGAYGSGMVMKWGGNIRNWGQGRVIGATRVARRVAGAGTAGLGGYVARNTIGRAASAAGESRWLMNQAARGGITGVAARGTIKGLDKTASSSFDVRRVGGVGKKLGIGEGAGKGGYNQQLKKQVEAREKVAKRLGDAPKSSADRHEEEQLREKLKKVEEAARSAVGETAQKAAKAEVDATKRALKDHLDKIERRGKQRKEAYARTLSTEGIFFGYGKVARKNKEAADKIRKGKSASDKIKDAVKEMENEDGGAPQPQQQQQENQQGGSTNTV